MLTIPVVGDSDYKHSRISLFVVFIFLQKDFKPNWTWWLKVERLAEEDLRDLAIKKTLYTMGAILFNTSTEWSTHLTKKGKSDCFFPNFVTL